MKILYSLAMILASAMTVNAQVTNYALELEPQGHVNCGSMPEMEGLASYTVQFWINPASWIEGAKLISLGNRFSATLGSTGEIIFTSGNTTLTASSSALKPGAWAQYTLVCDNGRASATVNGAEAASGTLDAIPAAAGEFVIGGGYTGRIDEIRLWKAVLADRYDRFMFNTINRWNPQWEDLYAYYKMDQDECADLVEYKAIEADEEPAFNNHGIISESGARRVNASDNT
ncbi:MAG: LamG domain-containing protein, partial [Muribaculaceae bacterium]|nr:LamG domain-containing protein [Muribaculaceae bacterium]